MNKYKLSLLAFITFIFSSLAFADEPIDMKLMNATFPFQLCVRNVTDESLQEMPIKKIQSIQSGELEGQIWSHVILECNKYLNDEAKGLILLHFKGDNAKAIGYFEGVIYSGRSYVISKSIDSKQKHP
jgi:hypothetical protein